MSECNSLCTHGNPPRLRKFTSKEKPDIDKLVALKFLGHWVGDIHQPLHVSFEDDRGGNDIKVTGQCTGNLHATWDTCLVQYAVGPYISDAVADLLETVTPELTAQWNASNPRDWANEYFLISEAAATGYCEMHASSCDLSSRTMTISAEYLDRNEAVVGGQLQKAGVRLAHLLDKALAK